MDTQCQCGCSLLIRFSSVAICTAVELLVHAVLHRDGEGPVVGPLHAQGVGCMWPPRLPCIHPTHRPAGTSFSAHSSSAAWPSPSNRSRNMPAAVGGHPGVGDGTALRATCGFAASAPDATEPLHPIILVKRAVTRPFSVGACGNAPQHAAGLCCARSFQTRGAAPCANDERCRLVGVWLLYRWCWYAQQCSRSPCEVTT